MALELHSRESSWSLLKMFHRYSRPYPKTEAMRVILSLQIASKYTPFAIVLLIFTPPVQHTRQTSWGKSTRLHHNRSGNLSRTFFSTFCCCFLFWDHFTKLLHGTPLVPKALESQNKNHKKISRSHRVRHLKNQSKFDWKIKECLL